VIVICPSCGTPYHHAVEERSSARIARCSQCSFTFPMPLGRSYRIESGSREEVASARVAPWPAPATLAPAPAPFDAETTVAAKLSGLEIGMDDPSLRPSLERTALTQEGGQPRQAMTYWLLAEGGADGESPSDVESLAEAAPTGERLHAADERVAAGRGPQAEASQPRRPRHPAVTLALGAGAGVTWGAALAAFAELPLASALVGGCACGLLLTGGVIAWNVRKS
jgi:hypothetical protein